MVSTEDLYIHLGKMVARARENAEISQLQLAERVGLTRTSISNIEHGRQKIQIHTLYALADSLGIAPAHLLPTTTQATEGELEASLPAYIPEDERDWVRRVLTSEEG